MNKRHIGDNCTRVLRRALALGVSALTLATPTLASAQQVDTATATAQSTATVAQRRASTFAHSRLSANGTAATLQAAQQQHADLAAAAARQTRDRALHAAGENAAAQPRGASRLASTAAPLATSLSTAWQPVGPMQVSTAAYGLVTGRVTAVNLDPADSTGNTVYLGTTGGGVWKSTNAAGAAASVTFAPLTDTLQVFSPNAGTSSTASLSIGAVAVQPGGTGVLLAGTGDPNDATDSYYGEGILRSPITAPHGRWCSNRTTVHRATPLSARALPALPGARQTRAWSWLPSPRPRKMATLAAALPVSAHAACMSPQTPGSRGRWRR